MSQLAIYMPITLSDLRCLMANGDFALQAPPPSPPPAPPPVPCQSLWNAAVYTDTCELEGDAYRAPGSKAIEQTLLDAVSLSQSFFEQVRLHSCRTCVAARVGQQLCSGSRGWQVLSQTQSLDTLLHEISLPVPRVDPSAAHVSHLDLC